MLIEIMNRVIYKYRFVPEMVCAVKNLRIPRVGDGVYSVLNDFFFFTLSLSGKH